ncbi:Histidine kinase [Pedobacter caeni]|uniref:Histidine kinase n=1 Tax=Pedobacter caeni TaxID=288992 RepID=A0A1M5EVC7_9SPHI|nr:Histidine kinase [Pedobacter caeni]
MVKHKIYRHLLFWLTYSIQGTLLEYAWIHDFFPPEREAYVVILAILFNLLLVSVKMSFSYYLMQFPVNNLLIRKNAMVKVILQIVLALLLAIFFYRLANVYVISPLLKPEKVVGISDIVNPSGLFIALLDIGYISGIAVALKLFRMQVLNLKTEQFLIKDKLETELKFLKNQINPHFLFNTLNNIYGLARKKSDQAPEVVLRLSKLLRFMLYESHRETISIAEEIRILEDYLELEKIRYDNRLKISFRKEIDDHHQMITPLILLPFIENAFKHGLNETTGESQIEIHITLKKGQLNFQTSNTQDYSGENIINEKIGLSNIRRQLELMYKEFSLELENFPKTFNVSLKINLNSHGTL